MKIEKVLVTGGGGFLGKAIVKKLIKKQITVTSFSRGAYPELEKLGVAQVQGDLADAKALEDACNGMDAVFHVAAKAGLWGDYEDFYSANVTGTRNVIHACNKKRVGVLVHTSSPSVVFDDGNQENEDESLPYPKKFLTPYQETKAKAEIEVKNAAGNGLPTIILRPHLIWGPEDNHIVPGIIKRAKRLKTIGPIDDKVDSIYVDNAADAHILAMQKLAQDSSLSGNVYFISQDEPISKWELANGFLKAAGLEPINGNVSAVTALIAGTIFEFVYKFFHIKKEPPITRFAAREAATSHWFNISRAKNDLGYVPKISIQEGLGRLQKWFSTMETR